MPRSKEDRMVTKEELNKIKSEINRMRKVVEESDSLQVRASYLDRIHGAVQVLIASGLLTEEECAELNTK